MPLRYQNEYFVDILNIIYGKTNPARISHIKRSRTRAKRGSVRNLYISERIIHQHCCLSAYMRDSKNIDMLRVIIIGTDNSKVTKFNNDPQRREDIFEVS